MNSKILQIISARNLLAVIGDSTGFYTIKVSHIRLVEGFQQADNGGHKITRREMPVIPWRGKLTGVDEVPGCVGVADGEVTARHLWVQSLTEDEFRAYQERQRQEILDSAPCSFTEMTRRHEAEHARLDQAGMIPVNEN